MAIDPIIHRIVIGSHPKGVPSTGLRVLSLLSFATFVGAVIYAKHVEPRSIEERIRKEMFPAPGAAPSAH